jgi:hypothetical protein
MKIVQSFWSKPSFHEIQNYTNSRKFGGWYNLRYFLLSTSFSCLTLKRHHREIDLYTDDEGYKIFIGLLDLPYNNVSLELNKLAHEDHRLWTSAKVMTIKSQQKPFVHIDCDVYLWKQIQPNADPRYLTAQSTAPLLDIYKNSLNEIYANLEHIPDCLRVRPKANSFIANIGFVGGNDLEFFQEFCDVSSKFLETNRKNLSLVDVGGFNLMMEEYLFTSMANYKNRKVDYFVQSSHSTGFYEPFLRINLTPFLYKYIHLIGAYKQNYYACETLELRLKHEFPDYYEKVCRAIKEKYPALFMDDKQNQARKDRLLKAIHVLYNNKLSDIENMKIRLVDGLEIIHAQDFIDPSDTFAAIKETDSKTGKVIKKQSNINNGKEAEELKFKVVDAITRQIAMFGILEFV